MRSLREREEEMWKPKRLDWESRREILARLRRALKRRGEIALAVVHGGFVESQVFRDIDVAVYTGFRVDLKEEPLYAYRLSDELTRQTGNIPVDVKLLDYAPPDFVVEALERGVILVERVLGLRARLLLRVREDRELLRRALRRASQRL